MKQTDPARLGWGTLLAYALPALVVALPTIPVYIHLPALYGVQMGLGLAVTGFVLLLARLFDALTDPLIGALSDRFGFRGAHRKPWIGLGAVIAGVGLVKLLNPAPGVDESYLLIWSIFLYAGWTMVAVPYLAWGAELSLDYDERTRITAWREGMALIGILGAGALTAATARMGWTEVQSTGAIAWMAVGLGAVVVPLLLWAVPDQQRSGKTVAVSGVQTWWRDGRLSIRSLMDNGPFLRLLSAWFLNGLANGVPAALFFIYLEDGLAAGAEDRPLFVLAYFAAAVAAIPLWLVLSRRHGKHRVWCWAMISACIAFAIVPFLPTGAFGAFAVVCLVTGMALGADLVLPPAIQADVIDYDRLRFGRHRAGLQFALWGMSTKFALALAIGLSLPLLDAFGFRSGNPTETGIIALIVIYAIVPIVIKTTAIAVIWSFPLTAKKHAVIRRRLNRQSSETLNQAEAAI
ncbi:MAG: MFS transporter [Rhodospirillales bacterium]|jgi:glycoside/pentoside/hexuronide:cation symporter, GPH family|nr:MFS transporter [Rhodospirillales bacterium]